MIELQSGPDIAPASAFRKNDSRRKRLQPAWWLWGNVLSLDAPTVAVLWHLLLSRALTLSTGWAEPLVLGLSVWVIYLIDHLLDTRGIPTGYPEPARKAFFRDHWRLMSSIAGAALILTIAFARMFLNGTLFWAGIVGGIFVLSYFGAVHVLPARFRQVWPREAVVALFFSSGICMPLWLQSGLALAVILPYALPLFLLCWVNCCAVELWDWKTGPNLLEQPNASVKWIAEHVILSACSTLGLAIGLALFANLQPMYLEALVLSTLSFAGVARLNSASSHNRQNVALHCVLIDLALCSPLPILSISRLPT